MHWLSSPMRTILLVVVLSLVFRSTNSSSSTSSPSPSPIIMSYSGQFSTCACISRGFAFVTRTRPLYQRRHHHREFLEFNGCLSRGILRGGGGGGKGGGVNNYLRRSSSSRSCTINNETDFPQDVRRALVAVRKACDITQNVQSQLSVSTANNDKLQKNHDDGQIRQLKQDNSPVTIADYAAQAIVLHELQKYFKDDVFLAEESSSALTMTSDSDDDLDDNTDEMIDQIQQLTNFETKDELLEAIDIGQSYYKYQTGGGDNDNDNDKSPPDRLWVLDPIDGTKGFLRGLPNGQYCIALALLEKGRPTIGILSCPNLWTKKKNNLAQSRSGDIGDDDIDQRRGCIFVAMKGLGCYEIGLDPPDEDDNSSLSSKHFERLSALRSSVNNSTDFDDDPYIADPSIARFCVGVEQGFNDPFGITKKMGKMIHGSLTDVDSGSGGGGEILHCTRMDSQVKYGVIARGDAEFYIRLPKDHKDNIWDVAAGALCLEEVGGTVTDTTGIPLDYSVGAKLPTVGILGARKKQLHDVLLDTYQKVTEGDEAPR
mmetsp:Transcript_19477/g.47045  ORF Transcript_19477/g.47045 Transcript_19477/m.47045 type:complete len:542 (+) Transcript_19477:75-1700(+)